MSAALARGAVLDRMSTAAILSMRPSIPRPRRCAAPLLRSVHTMALYRRRTQDGPGGGRGGDTRRAPSFVPLHALDLVGVGGRRRGMWAWCRVWEERGARCGMRDAGGTLEPADAFSARHHAPRHAPRNGRERRRRSKDGEMGSGEGGRGCGFFALPPGILSVDFICVSAATATRFLSCVSSNPCPRTRIVTPLTGHARRHGREKHQAAAASLKIGEYNPPFILIFSAFTNEHTV
jgi:hypothetical protein